MTRIAEVRKAIIAFQINTKLDTFVSDDIGKYISRAAANQLSDISATLSQLSADECAWLKRLHIQGGKRVYQIINIKNKADILAASEPKADPVWAKHWPDVWAGMAR